MKLNPVPCCLCLMLALSLLTGGVQRSAARTEMAIFAAGLSSLVICSGAGEATILVDADGNAVDPLMPCPGVGCADCVPGSSLALPVCALCLSAPDFAFSECGAVSARSGESREPMRADARGPPAQSQFP